MFPFSSLNWTAILLSVIACMVLGTIWYGPLFGKPWMKLVGLKQDDAKKGMVKTMTMGIINTFVNVIAIALVLQLVPLQNTQEIYSFMVIIWLGFVVANEASAMIWARGPSQLFLINIGYTFVMITMVTTLLIKLA